MIIIFAAFFLGFYLGFALLMFLVNKTIGRVFRGVDNDLDSIKVALTWPIQVYSILTRNK